MGSPYKFSEIAAINPSVTGTAQSLKQLIDTAISGSEEVSKVYDAIDILVEDGDIRYANQLDPTASAGFLMPQGFFKTFRNMALEDIILIRTGASDVKLSVDIGQSN